MLRQHQAAVDAVVTALANKQSPTECSQVPEECSARLWLLSAWWQMLVKMAHDGGSTDNITVMVLLLSGFLGNL